MTVVKNGRNRRPRRRHGDGQSALAEYNPEKYGEITKEKDECEPALLKEYALALTLFIASISTLTAKATARDLLPKKFQPLDLVVLGIATHKLSRIIAKARITGAIRAPFVHYICSCGTGEVEEEARGHGFQRAVGELISCPHCVNPWSAAALGFGMLFAPRATRFFSSILVAVAGADFLHRAYARLKDKTE